MHDWKLLPNCKVISYLNNSNTIKSDKWKQSVFIAI